MAAIDTLKAYRTFRNAENVDDAIAEIQHSYELLDEQAAEIDRLRAERDALRAENERLRKQVSKTNVEVRSEECDRLRAENAELLDFIGSIADSEELAGHSMMRLVNEARAILAKTAKEG